MEYAKLDLDGKNKIVKHVALCTTALQRPMTIWMEIAPRSLDHFFVHSTVPGTMLGC